MEYQINYLAVLVAALSSFVLGGLWYGPLFGKVWMAASGVTDADIKNTNFPKVYGVTFVMSVIAAYVLAHIVSVFDARGVVGGLQTGFWTWLGFMFTVKVTDALFNRVSFKLVWIDSGYRLVWSLVMGLILAMWR